MVGWFATRWEARACAACGRFVMGFPAGFCYKGREEFCRRRHCSLMILPASPIACESRNSTGNRCRMGQSRGVALQALAVVAALGAGIVSARAEAARGCPQGDGPSVVAAVGMHGELVLEDGRLLKLAGLALDFGDDDHAAARDTALRELAVGRRILVASAAPEGDRYGRLVGVARIEGEAQTLQHALIELGLAVLRPDAAHAGCLEGLAAAERSAREARLGLWASLPVKASDVAAVRALEGRYGVIEGRVASVGDRRAALYLNFGRVWRQDLTVTVPQRFRSALNGAKIPLDDMSGRLVRVRGVVFEEGGPAIEVREPGQIELVGNEDR